MSDKCTCPSVMKGGTRFPMIRDRDCPEHGDNAGILRDMKDEKQAEIERLRGELAAADDTVCEQSMQHAHWKERAQQAEAERDALAEQVRVLREVLTGMKDWDQFKVCSEQDWKEALADTAPEGAP